MNLEVVRIDEPTAALDSVNKSRIIALLFGLEHDSGSTIVTVTRNDASLADQHALCPISIRGCTPDRVSF